MIGNKYGKGLGEIAEILILHPGLASPIRLRPKLVARADLAFFTTGLKTADFHPTWEKTIPSSSTSNTQRSDDGHPIVIPRVRARATFEVGFSCTPLDPTLVNASGLALRGIQFEYKTPYSMSGNLTLQYQITPTLTFQAGYVTSLARHLEVFPGSNRPTQVLPVDATVTRHQFPPAQGGLPVP